MKVGILAHDFVAWAGGVDFLRIVIDSMLAPPRAENVEFHLLIPDSGPRSMWRWVRRHAERAIASRLSGKGPAANHTPSPAIVSNAFAEFHDRITIQHIDIGKRALRYEATRLDLDAVVPAAHSLGAGFPRPWVGYVYDFQHKYFPQHFTPEDRHSRNEHFTQLAMEARAVVVNSRAVAGDIAKFMPLATARVFVMPFAPAPGRGWLENRPDILPRYGVAAPFFMVSNQFWIHKDHATAFDAFRRVAEYDPDLTLVCTGSTVDSRGPDHFSGLVDSLKRWGLDHRVRILGLIPKRDQIELMKNACAVVQPTLFEGGPGGGAVYDAVSLDVPVIVSDIPVNRELDGAALDFFPAGDAESLAAKMQARLLKGHTRAPNSELIAMGQRRRAACGDVLWSAVDCVL